jgi:hypothetical protein
MQFTAVAYGLKTNELGIRVGSVVAGISSLYSYMPHFFNASMNYEQKQTFYTSLLTFSTSHLTSVSAYSMADVLSVALAHFTEKFTFRLCPLKKKYSQSVPRIK